MLYFTSDQHFFHKNIINHAERPFKDTNEMNEHIIAKYNDIVTDKDEVWMLGDFSFGTVAETWEIFGNLRGRKHLVYGNHDRKLRPELAKMFLSVQDYKELKYDHKWLILMHYPLHSWNKGHYGTIHLHGHCHGNLPFNQSLPRIDVGVDVWNYAPVSFEQVIDKIQDAKAPYHH